MDNFRKKLEDLNVNSLNNIFKVTNKVLKILYFLLIVVAIYVIVLISKEWNLITFLLDLLKILSPFFIGFVIAWLFNPLILKMTKNGVSKMSAVILVYFLVLVFLYFFTLLIIPSMSSQINDLVSSIPIILNETKDIVNGIFDKFTVSSVIDLESIKQSFFDKLSVYGSSLTTNLPTLFVMGIKSLVSGIGVILFGFIIGFYISFEYEKVNEGLINLFPKNKREDIKDLVSLVSASLYNYVKGTLLISFILFLVSTIGFSIIGLNAPLMFGLFCGITNLIPYIGPYIGGIPAVLIGFSQSTVTGILVLAFIVVVQTIEGCFLQPIIMSKKMNLSPLTIIIMLLIFGAWFGIIGMILATPVAALLKIIYLYLVEKYNLFGNKNSNKEKSKIKK